MRKTICVDLDGVLLDFSGEWEGWDKLPPPINGAKEFMAELRELGEVVVFTCRCAPDVCRPSKPVLAARVIANHLEAHAIPFDHVWHGEGKPIAVAYIDDRAVPCDPMGVIPAQNRDKLRPSTYGHALGTVKMLCGFKHDAEPDDHPSERQSSGAVMCKHAPDADGFCTHHCCEVISKKTDE